MTINQFLWILSTGLMNNNTNINQFIIGTSLLNASFGVHHIINFTFLKLERLASGEGIKLVRKPIFCINNSV